MTATAHTVPPGRNEWPTLGAVARGANRVNSSISALIPDRVAEAFDALPGSDVMLLGPRVARALAEVQDDRRPTGARIDEITFRHLAEAAMDEIALSFLKGASTVGAAQALEESGTYANTVASLIEHGDIADSVDTFNPAPPPPDNVKRHRRPVGHRGIGKATHYSFDSGYEVPPTAPGAVAWQHCERKRVAHVYAFEYDDNAPWLINLHGFKQGDPNDFFSFRSAATRERFGVNVIHPVLPFHGRRRHPTDPLLPNIDWAVNVFGLAQSVWDVRRTIAWIRQRSDAPILVHGVSLGGYLAALLAGLSDELAGVIVGLPVVDFPEIMRRHAGRMPLSVTEMALFELPAIDAFHGLVSPLALKPRVPESGRYIYAARLDQVSSVDQAAVLSEHWGSSSVHWCDGGHVSAALWDGSVKSYIDGAIEETLGAAQPVLSSLKN